MKKLFILSKAAGNGNFSELKNKIEDVYKKYNRESELEIVLTKDKNHATKAAEEFKRETGEKLVVVCGGDGTLSEVANVLSESDVAISLIPMGTGNDFSKNFDYQNFKIENTFEPKISPIDLIQINDRKCINVMSLGFDTQVLSNTYHYLEKNPKLQKNAFILGVIKTLFNIEYSNLELELCDSNGKTKTISGKFLISALCNGSYYGSGYRPAPFARIDDGVLNLILVEKISVLKLLLLLKKYRTGEHLKNKSVHEILLNSGKIKSDKKILCNIDGEIFETDEIYFKVIKNALKWAYIADFNKNKISLCYND